MADFQCISKQDELDAFEAETLNVATSCPSISQLQETGSSFGESYLIYYATEDGILNSIEIPSFSFSEEPTPTSFRISVTTEPYLLLQIPSRRKRNIVPVLYQEDFIDVVFFDFTGFVVEFSPPIFVSENTELYVNVLKLDNSAYSQLYYEVADPLFFLRCPMSPSLDPVNNASCYKVFEDWTALQDDFISLGCAEQPSVSYRNYEACLRAADSGELNSMMNLLLKPTHTHISLSFHCKRQRLEHYSNKRSENRIIWPANTICWFFSKSFFPFTPNPDPIPPNRLRFTRNNDRELSNKGMKHEKVL